MWCSQCIILLSIAPIWSNQICVWILYFCLNVDNPAEENFRWEQTVRLHLEPPDEPAHTLVPLWKILTVFHVAQNQSHQPQTATMRKLSSILIFDITQTGHHFGQSMEFNINVTRVPQNWFSYNPWKGDCCHFTHGNGSIVQLIANNRHKLKVIPVSNAASKLSGIFLWNWAGTKLGRESTSPAFNFY